MAWNGLTLTVDGRQALTDAQMSNRMNFRAIVIGDGDPPTNFNTQKALVHQLYEITDIDVEVSEEGCTITGDFPKVDYDYYFREIGLIVTTEDGDRLYVYDNCGNDAQYIVSTTGVETNKKRIRLSLMISNVAEITVSTPTILYVDYETYKKDLSKLVDNNGGDISETMTTVEEPTATADKYPELSGKGSTKTVLGKLFRWARSLKEDKVDKSGGDIASTKVVSLQTSTVQYPVPEAGDTTKVVIGKIKKFFEDIRNTTIGACYIGQIVNNCVTKRADLPLAAEQGEVLMNLYTVLNANFTSLLKRDGSQLAKLGIFPKSMIIKITTSTPAYGTAVINLSAKNVFAFETVPSNFMVIGAFCRATTCVCMANHSIGTYDINITFRNVSGTEIGATDIWITILAVCM